MVVSDTSPIANLAAIGQLELLRQLYGEVAIPQAVFRELSAMWSHEQQGEALPGTPWIQTCRVTNQRLAGSLLLQLDPGEAEAIALAIETQSALLLMDERRGRRIAGGFGLKCIGVLGLLVEAKRKGLIAAVRPHLDALVTRAGFRIARGLYARVLTEVGE